VTGLDCGADSRIFVHVNNSGLFHVPGMTLEEAIELVRLCSGVTGIAKREGRDRLLEAAHFSKQQKLRLKT
jgi:hypothetical protein